MNIDRTNSRAVIHELLGSNPLQVKRRESHVVQIGSAKIGGCNPIAIQAMTNTDTADSSTTVDQIVELVDSGAELVRISVNTDAAARSVPKIKEKLISLDRCVPIIGDFHYNGHILLSKYPACARALDKYRINPGNVGVGSCRDSNFESMIQTALKYDKPVRIGVNWGSLDRQILSSIMNINSELSSPRSNRQVLSAATVASALQSALLAEDLGMPPSKLVLSTKLSSVRDTVSAYVILAQHCEYALHVGITEAGIGDKGIVASATALAPLLLMGIGDTIRVSITPTPGESRTKEVRICQLVLQEVGIRQFGPSVTSCPGCGRTASDRFQRMAKDVDEFLQTRSVEWKNRVKASRGDIQVAVMGCVVNGPGESRQANVGICLPGVGEDPRMPVYVDGKLHCVLEGSEALDEFKSIVEHYVESQFAGNIPDQTMRAVDDLHQVDLLRL